MTTHPSQPLRVLMIGVCEEGAVLAIEALQASGLDPVRKNAASREQIIAALDEGSWDLVLSDYALPAFDGLRAVALVRQRDADVPFILVCGAIGEDVSAEVMRAGASDVVLRDRLWRLAPAIERELHEASSRRERRRSMALIKDVTAQKLAERELLGREPERVFKAVVENTPDLIARFSRDLRRRYVNPAIERLTGLPFSALTGKTMSDLNFEARFSERIEQGLAEVFTTGAEVTLEVVLPTPAGERVFQARIVPEPGPAGEVEFALVISRDITTLRRDEERLRALTGEVELLLASTYEGICATDLQGRCTLVNASAASMLGDTAAGMMGRNFHELIHDRQPDGQACTAGVCSLVKAAEEGKPAHIMDEVLRRKDGTSFPVEIFVSPILSDDETVRGIIFSFIDVTERQHLQTELERANRMAGLGRVASAVSHEFNNVLMGIQPFAEILLRSSQEPRVIEAAKRIIQSVDRGRGITEDLRTFTRPVPPVRTLVDVRSWLSEFSGELGRLLPPSVRFDVDIADTPMAIEVDRNQVSQVLSSIVLNAREAIGGGKGAIRLSVHLTTNPGRLQSDEPFVDFSVADDGPGIDPRNLSRVSEPFYTTTKSGKGLGLAIAQQIATLHGGYLFVESEVGTGTTVRFYLPASRKNEAEPVDPHRRRSVRGRWPAEILLVEDDEAVASGVVMLLEDENVKVRLAAGGAEALKILQSYKPQALVIDINLPDCNGFDLYEQITESFGPLPVVFASGHADTARLGNLKTSAGVRLLAKPYDIDSLLDLLDSVAPSGV